MGATLLAFGGHALAQPQRLPRFVDAKVRVVSPPRPLQQVDNEHDHIKDFAMSRLVPDDNSAATFEAMVEAYMSWCGSERIEALPLDHAAQQFAEMVNHLELKVENRDGDPVVIGVAVQKPGIKLIEAA